MSEEMPTAAAMLEPETAAAPVAATAAPAPRDDELHAELRRAFMACHAMDAQHTQETYRAAVDVTALTELLIAKGVIGLTEFDERRKTVGNQVAAQRARTWTGPTLFPMTDTQAKSPPILIDCEKRYPSCSAGCCTLYNVYLTAEEVRSGHLLWDLGEPYRLMRGPEGHCIYLDRETLRCTTWATRPGVCRSYSCATDTRIWTDFEKMEVTEAALRLRARRTVAAMAASPAVDSTTSETSKEPS